jgi:S1-C subfamily serine protease
MRVVVPLVAVVVIAAGAAGWYWFLHSPGAASPAGQTASSGQASPASEEMKKLLEQADAVVRSAGADGLAPPPKSDEGKTPAAPAAKPDASPKDPAVERAEAALRNASLEDVISLASPAVVSIETTTMRGSGFFVGQGTVVTNAHVVGNEGYVKVKLATGASFTGRVATSMPDYDLALVRVDRVSEEQPVLVMGALQSVRAGQEVIAIGSALGVLQNTVTRGIVSAIRRAGPVFLIQTDAAINRGNSGGPLLDRHGRVIGVTTWKMSGGAAESIGFAVAVDHVRPLLEGTRPPPVAGGGSATTVPSGLAPQTKSETDAARDEGTQTFDRAMQVLSRRADQIDDYWNRFRASCSPQFRSATGDREWFGVSADRPTIGTQVAECGAWVNDLVELSRQFRQAMSEADEGARRAQVYPGVTRDLRRRYRLDWSGWDR